MSDEPNTVMAAAVPAAEYRRLQAVYRMTAALIRAAALEDIYDEALKGLLAAVGADRASVLVFDEAEVMRFVAWRGLSAEYRRAVDGHSPWRPDSADARPIVMPDVALDATLGAYRDVILGEGIRALVFVPLLWERGVLGKFMLYFDEPHDLSDSDLRLAETIAGHVSIALVRTRADAELRRRTREFATLADNAPDVIARFDRELRHLYVNPAITRATGIAHDRFIGRTNEELGMPAALVEQWADPLRSVFATGRARRFEFTYAGPAGEQRFESMITPEPDADGQVESVLAITRDVTDRWRASRTLATLARASDVIVSSLETPALLERFAELLVAELADGCAIDLVTADGELERAALVTRDPAKAELVRRLEALYPTPLDAPVAHVTAIRTGRPAVYVEVTDDQLRVAARDETHLALWREFAATSVLCAPLRARGRTLGAVTLVHHAERRFDGDDLALVVQLCERVALALDNARLYAEALAANQTKSTFLATMSHELRTPLNAILGYADLMAAGVGGTLPELQRGHVGRIQASAHHLLAVIEGLLSYSRLEAAGERLNVTSLDMAELAAQALELVRPAAASKALELRLDGAAPLRLTSDAQKLLQILLNLLGNAIKFTARGEVAVELERAGDEAVVRVRDTGDGISAPDLERIFEPFWQVDSGPTRRLGGTGLGLTVSRQLAELLGGSLAVTSEVCVGSVFTLRVPLDAAAHARRAAEQQPRRRAGDRGDGADAADRLAVR